MLHFTLKRVLSYSQPTSWLRVDNPPFRAKWTFCHLLITILGKLHNERIIGYWWDYYQSTSWLIIIPSIPNYPSKIRALTNIPHPIPIQASLGIWGFGWDVEYWTHMQNQPAHDGDKVSRCKHLGPLSTSMIGCSNLTWPPIDINII